MKEGQVMMVMLDGQEIEMEIKKLRVHPGDLVTISTDLFLTREQCEQLRDALKPYVPDGVKVLVVTSGIRLEVGS